MSKTVDNRVVEMRFDNAQFEKNVKESMSTLEKLKHALKFDDSAKSLDSLSKSVNGFNTSGMATAVETVTQKFSALEVVAITALANITNKAINAGEQLVKSLSTDQIAAGYDKYTQKVEGVQTIMSATGLSVEEVNASLEKLNWFTDETSYNFTDMVSSIGKFTSAGMELDDSVTAMEGIATWAARSGASTQKATSAFYNLSQAMGTGAMKLQDWKSIQNVNMATEEFKQTAIDTALALGKLKKAGDGVYQAIGSKYTFTNASFAEQLKDGWFDTEVIMATLKQYGAYADAVYEVSDSFDTCSEAMEHVSEEGMELGAAAFRAAQEAKSFSEAIDSVKDAVSTGWMNTFELIFGNYEEAKVLWTELANDLWDLFASGGVKRNEMLGSVMTSDLDVLIKKVEDCGVPFSEFEKELMRIGVISNDVFKEMVNEGATVSDVMNAGLVNGNLIRRVIGNLISSNSEYSSSVEATEEQLKKFQNVVNDVWIKGLYGTGTERVKKLTEAGYDAAQVQKLVNIAVSKGKIELSDLSDVELKQIGCTEEQIKALRELSEEYKDNGAALKKFRAVSGRELLVDSFRNGLHGLIDTVELFKEAWSDIFPPTSRDVWYEILEKVHDLSKGLIVTEDKADKLKRTFRGLFAVLDIALTTINRLANFAFKGLHSILGDTKVDVFDLTASFGDNLVALRDWYKENDIVTKGLERLVEIFKQVKEKAVEYFDAFVDLPLVQAIIGEITTKFEEFVTYMKTNFPEIVEEITAFIDDVKAMDTLDFRKIAEHLETFAEIFSSSFDLSSFSILGLQNKLTTFLSGTFLKSNSKIKGKIEETEGQVSGFVENITASLEQIDGSKIAALGMAGGLLLTFQQFTRAMTALTPLQSIAGSIVGTLGAIKGVFVEWKNQLKLNTLQKVATAILILCGALAVLAFIPTDKLHDSVIALVEVAGILLTFMTLMAVMEKFKISVNFTAMATGMVLMSASLAILAGALLILTKIDTSKLGIAIVALVVLMESLAIVAVLMSAAVPQLAKGGGVLIGFALSLLILVKVLGMLTVVNVGLVERALLQLLPIMFTLSLVAKATSGVKFSSTAGLLVFIISLVALEKALQYMIDKGVSFNDIKDHLEDFVAVMGIIALLSLSTSLAGKHAIQAAVSIVILTGAMTLMIGLIKLISTIDEDDLIRGEGALGGLAIMMSLMMVCAKFADESKVKAITTLVAATVALTIELLLLSTVPIEELAPAFAALSLVMLAFGETIQLMNATGKNAPKTIKLLGELIVIAGVVFGFCKAMELLAGYDWKTILASGAALSLVMYSFSKALVVISEAKQINLKQIGVMIVAAGMIVLLGASLAIVATQNWANILAAGVALSLVITTFAGVFTIISKCGKVDPTAAFGLFLSSLALLIPITASIYILCNKPWEGMLGAAAAISLTLIALSVALGIVSAFTFNPVGAESLLLASVSLIPIAGALSALTGYTWEELKNSVIAIGLTLGELAIAMAVFSLINPAACITACESIVIAIAGISAIIAALAGLSKIPGYDEVMAGGTKVLEDIGNAIGSFFGSIVGGFLNDTVKNLPYYAEQLSKFGEQLSGFTRAASKVDQSVVDGTSNICDIITTIAKMEFKKSFFGSGFDPSGFGNDLVQLGSDIAEFCKAVSSVGTDSVTAASNAAGALAAMVEAVPGTGGFINEIMGEHDLAAFGKALPDFGKNISKFAETVKDVKQEDVEGASKAGTIVADMASKIPNQGGMLATLIGDNTLVNFSKQLPEFGENIASFAGIVKDVKKKDVEGAVNAGTIIAEMANKIPNQGGKLAELIGDNTLSSFAKQLPEFGKNISDFANNLTAKIDVQKVESAAGAAEIISTFSKNLPNTGGFLGKLVGNNDLLEFARQLPEFASCVSQFSDNLRGVSPYNVTNNAMAIKALAEIEFPVSLLGNPDIVSFGGALVSLGDNVGAYYAKIADLDTMKMGLVTNALRNIAVFAKDIGNMSNMKSFSDWMRQAGDDGIAKFLNVFETAGPKITTAINAFTSAFKTGIESRATDYVGYGSYTQDKMIEGIKQESTLSKVRTAFKDSALAGVNAARDSYSDFYNAGTYMVSGFISGIRDHKAGAISAAAQMASESYRAAKSALDINSPSRKFAELGMYSALGMARGMRDSAPIAEQEAENAAVSMLETASTTMLAMASIINEGIEDGLNISPVITPVVDLNGVQRSTDALNGMWNAVNFKMGGLSSRLASFNSNMEVNSNNVDVVNAIESLQDNLESLSAKVGNLQVVLDSGILVGAISGQMDVALGQTYKRKARGV